MSDTTTNRPGPSIGLIIATHSFERLDMLKAAVDSVEHNTLRPDKTIIVVDHNPELAAVIDDIYRPGTTRQNINVVPNTGQKGLGAARNTGLAHLSDHDIIAFLDDDATADPDWLTELVKPFSDPNVWGTGGWADANWHNGQRPRWWPPSFDWVIGCSYEGMHFSGPIRNPIGCSMAFRQDAFTLLGGFAPNMGRRGNQPLGCEETEFSIRLTQMRPDAIILAAPRSKVTQEVPPARATLNYLLARCWAEGISKATVVANTGADDGLSAERRHLTATVKHIRRDLLRNPRRSLVITIGTITTVLAYAYGRLTMRTDRTHRETGVRP